MFLVSSARVFWIADIFIAKENLVVLIKNRAKQKKTQMLVKSITAKVHGLLPYFNIYKSILQTLGSLEEITMPQNGIRPEGVLSLAEAFKENKNLKVSDGV